MTVALFKKYARSISITWVLLEKHNFRSHLRPLGCCSEIRVRTSPPVDSDAHAY